VSADAEGEEGGEISDTERGLEGGGDSSFSLEVPLTAWGANDFDRGAILDRLRERQPHASSHSAASISKSLRTGNPMLRMVKMFSPSRRVPQDTRPAETETQVPCAHQDSDSQAPRSRVRASWDNDGEALSSSVSRTQMRHAEDDVRLDNQMRHSEDDVRLDKDEARRDKELEARILSRLENRRERGVAGHARGGSVPQSSHAEGGDGSAGEYGEHVQGSASPLEAWARVTAGAEVREMRGEEFLAGERGDAPIVNPPSAVGAARGASAGAVDAEGGRAAGTGAGGCEEGFSAQLAAIVAGLHDVVTSVQSSHVAAELRSLSDDQLMAAAATHSDPLAPSPWEVPGKEGASGSRMSEASLRRRAARPFRQVNEENVSPAPSPNRVLTSGSPTKRASQKRPASAGREAADHFNTSRSPFACISPHKQRCAADDAANNSPHASRRAARAASVSPHRQPKARGGSRGRNSREASASPRREPDTSNGAQGAAHAVAEAVSSISQWRPRWPISSAANSHLAPGQGASQGGAASAVSLPLPLRTTVSGDSGTAATSVHSATAAASRATMLQPMVATAPQPLLARFVQGLSHCQATPAPPWYKRRLSFPRSRQHGRPRRPPKQLLPARSPPWVNGNPSIKAVHPSEGLRAMWGGLQLRESGNLLGRHHLSPRVTARARAAIPALLRLRGRQRGGAVSRQGGMDSAVRCRRRWCEQRTACDTFS
jgi:hypothetical protein